MFELTGSDESLIRMDDREATAPLTGRIRERSGRLMAAAVFPLPEGGCLCSGKSNWRSGGDLACFTRPELKAERVTYDVPTPSALRGILDAIYSRPASFYWQINCIEVLRPIRHFQFVRNEVSQKAGRISFQCTDEGIRLQRSTVALRDVHYRVAASLRLREGCTVSAEAPYTGRAAASKAESVITSRPWAAGNSWPIFRESDEKSCLSRRTGIWA